MKIFSSHIWKCKANHVIILSNKYSMHKQTSCEIYMNIKIIFFADFSRQKTSEKAILSHNMDLWMCWVEWREKKVSTIRICDHHIIFELSLTCVCFLLLLSIAHVIVFWNYFLIFSLKKCLKKGARKPSWKNLRYILKMVK